MTYTILAAQYANEVNTAAVIQTKEAGAVLASANDTPDLWAAMLARVPQPTAFVPPGPSSSVEMWRSRAIMKITPWKGATLWDAVLAAIAQLPGPVERVIAEEALNGSGQYDRNGVFVPKLAAIVGIDDATHDALMQQAAALPA